MSVFNGEQYLDEAVRSILGQTFSDFEFIVVDDGSTDSTPAMLAEYRARDSRITIFNRQNEGQASALNCACERARGKYLFNLDADDVALPSRIAKQLAFLEENPDTVLLGTASRMIWADGRTIKERIPPTDDASIRQELATRASLCHTSIAMRKEAFLAAGGYRAPFKCGQDYDLFLRIAEHGRVANLDEILVLHRIHGNQKSALNVEQMILAGMAAQVGARLRRQNKSDKPLLDGEGPLSRATLKRLGVSEEDIDRAILVVIEGHLAIALSPERPSDSNAQAEAFIERVKEFCSHCSRETLLSGDFPSIVGMLNMRASAVAV